MLGIGADDIFVLLDVWKQSAQRYTTNGEAGSTGSSVARKGGPAWLPGVADILRHHMPRTEA